MLTAQLTAVTRARLRRLDQTYRIATASMRALPDFLIIGESKCGTTSLYDDIVEHPSVLPAATKEIQFFSAHFHRGLDWYRAQFPLEWRMRRDGNRNGRFQTGEASPYYLSHPLAPQRIQTVLPSVKAIAMLRNPIDRAYSQYQHEVRRNRETLSFGDAVAREPERLLGERERMTRDGRYKSREHRRHAYLARGVYVDHLRTWCETFDRRQVLVIRSEDYFAAPDATLRQIFEFLELPAWMPPRFAKKNVGEYSPIDPQIRKALADYFAPHNARLADFLGVDYGWQ
ncbi:MAG TPA: sulfotransferase domain-containing protein [Vicinamibacterales bacterium]|nr:sulfotransferase domain-containing protein [Vicinamibacterales bacterium]